MIFGYCQEQSVGQFFRCGSEHGINGIPAKLQVVYEETVCLQLADEVFLGLNREAIAHLIVEMPSDFCCGITPEENPEKIRQNYSVEILDGSRVLRCVEKPASVPNNLKGTGMCFMRQDILPLLGQIYDSQTGTPRDLCDFINYLIAQGRTVTALPVARREFNINTPADLDEAAAILENPL